MSKISRARAALGYFAGKAVGKVTKHQMNIFSIWVSAMLPDVDLLFRGFLIHRCPTHSIVVAALIFVPLLVMRPRKAAPFLAALATHSLIGDYITGGCQLLWPLSRVWISVNTELWMGSVNEIMFEIILFVSMIMALMATKVYRLARKQLARMVWGRNISVISSRERA